MDETRATRAIRTGTWVRMHAGPWKGACGAVHPLTETVGGEQTLIVELDTTTSSIAFAPRSGLVVVERSHAVAARRPARQERETR